MVETPSPLSRPRTTVVALIFTVALVAGGWMFQRGTASQVIAPVHGTMLFDQVRAFVAERYLDTVSDAQTYRLAIDGAMNELGDPYNAFIPPDRLTALNERVSDDRESVGLDVDLRDESVLVINSVAGGPADRAGVLLGDRITEVDGRSVHGWTPDEVQKVLGGPPGSKVTLAVQRPGSVRPTQLTLTRSSIRQIAVPHVALLPGNVGYVSLKMFNQSAVQELTRAVDSLVHMGATSLIVDVRGNLGEVFEQGVGGSELFLNPGQEIVRARGRVAQENHDYVDSITPRWPKLPMSVLVDERTASAAEVFAGALQDHDRAAIIGSPTYGKGSAQTVMGIDTSGAAIKLTTARWFTPSGRSITRLEPTDDDVQPADTVTPKFKTDAGRTVLGGGGITPDKIVDDTLLGPEYMAFLRGLGPKVGAFRDALKAYALSVKAAHAVTSPNFAVTQPMLDALYKQMQARGIDIPQMVYTDARPLVSRVLSYEVAQQVFGENAEVERHASYDVVIQTAERVLMGAHSETDVFERLAQVTQMARAAKASHSSGT